MNIIWLYLRAQKKPLIVALVLATVNEVFSLLNPQVTRILIDKYATQASVFTQSEYVEGVSMLLLAFIGFAFISRTAKAFQDYFVNVTTESTGTRMYADGVRHVFGLSFASFEDERSGSILLNLQKARDDAKKFIASVINDVFLAALGILLVLGYSLFVHWAIALTFLILIPLVGITTVVLSKKIKEAQAAIVAESADLAGSTTETLRNVGLVKALGLERQEIGRLNEVNEKVLDLELKKVVMLRKLTFIQGTLVNLVRAILLFVTLYLVWSGDITIGEFTLFFFYSFAVFNPLYNLATVVAHYQEAHVSSRELGRILSLPRNEYEGGEVSVETIRTISFANVSYQYKGAGDNALKDVSLEIKKGQTVALVGTSGSGKSTVVKLLTGLYKPQSGTLTINGTDSHDIDFTSFKGRIGYVSQETQLFSGTIRENLQFVNPDARDEECQEVLRQASIAYLLERGDDEKGKGLDARIGETGIKLSGGERQRLAIARALLRNPDLLIFDEATSALDSLTEREITETIKTIRRHNEHLSMLVIAHRLSTIAHADAIYVLQKGEVVQQGDHKSLLVEDGLYRALWMQQGGDKL